MAVVYIIPVYSVGDCCRLNQPGWLLCAL